MPPIDHAGTFAGPARPTRRLFLEGVAHGAGAGFLAAALAGCTSPAGPGASGEKRMRAAFSNAGLSHTWCALGKDAAELWGKLIGVDIEWIDGESDSERQRNKIENIVYKDWDFCCFQAVQTDSLAAPVNTLRDRGIPVIAMDVLLVDEPKMRETGVWTLVTPDQVFMGESSTRYLMEKIGGKGKVIHIGGLSAHSGAQGRKQGFENVVKAYPNVEVVGGGVRWCDWKPEKARDTFESLLAQEKEPIAGAFFHNDDMALACAPAKETTIHKNMILTGVDGQKDGLNGVRDGVLGATTVNPASLVHCTALFLGQFIARNREAIDKVPKEIIAHGPLVSLERPKLLEAMYYMSEPAHCMI
ncbi:MAG: sugar ABC transporter substrate-binding protein [Planctomycetaceae bacterium]